MDFNKAVDSVPLIDDLRRIAGSHLPDCQNLNEIEIREGLKRLRAEYLDQEKIKSKLDYLFHQSDRDTRILSSILIEEILLDSDNYTSSQKQTDGRVVLYQQKIINWSVEGVFVRNQDRYEKFEELRVTVETVWKDLESLPADKLKILEELRVSLGISVNEYRAVEAKLGKFPKMNNVLHNRAEIDRVRRILQEQGLVFPFRGRDGNLYDVIPSEIAKVLRNELKIELRKHGYRELLNVRYLRSKVYLKYLLKAAGIEVEEPVLLKNLQDICLEFIRPFDLLRGFGPDDKEGLHRTILVDWASELSLVSAGTQDELVNRILNYYDNLLAGDGKEEWDDRVVWYNHYDDLARNDLYSIRSSDVAISSDQVDQRFIQATDYIFEKKLFNNPLRLRISRSPDGALAYQDKLIYWFNIIRSKPVSLQDEFQDIYNHLDEARKKVDSVLVIASRFTEDSGSLAMQYHVDYGTTMTLIRAEDLKEVAENWALREPNQPLPLSYLIQPGIFNKALIPVNGAGSGESSGVLAEVSG